MNATEGHHCFGGSHPVDFCRGEASRISSAPAAQHVLS